MAASAKALDEKKRVTNVTTDELKEAHLIARLKYNTNTIEGFWAQIKNSVRGVHHGVAPYYLQQYVNEYVFRYNHRKDVTPLFMTILSRASLNWDG